MTGDAPVEAPTCRICREPMVPIMYGMPAPEAMDAAARGDFVLGGCMVDPAYPSWSCLQHRDEVSS